MVTQGLTVLGTLVVTFLVLKTVARVFPQQFAAFIAKVFG